MIRKGKYLVLLVQKDMLQMIELVEERVLLNIGAIYKGTLLVWLTIYNAVKSCYGGGTWLGDKPWIEDNWRNE